MKQRNSKTEPVQPYVQPKVYFLLPRTIDQIKKVYPIPYQYQLPNLNNYIK